MLLLDLRNILRKSIKSVIKGMISWQTCIFELPGTVHSILVLFPKTVKQDNYQDSISRQTWMNGTGKASQGKFLIVVISLFS